MPTFFQIVMACPFAPEPKSPITTSCLPLPKTSPTAQVTRSQSPVSRQCRANTPGAGLLEHDRGVQLFLLASLETYRGQEADGHKVEIAIAVQVGSHRPVNAVHRRQRVMREGQVAGVLQPLNAVIRLEQVRLIEHVAVGVQHIEFAVAVEIDQLNAAGAVAGVRRPCKESPCGIGRRLHSGRPRWSRAPARSAR